jgi:hypothetical protein
MSTNTVTTVTSQANPLAYMKAVAALVGAVVTGLLGIYGGDSEVGQVLTIVSVIASAIVTWVVPNALVVPVITDEGEVVGDDVTDDGYSYEESGGQPFPTDADEGSLYGKPGTTLYEGDAPDYGAGDPHRG